MTQKWLDQLYAAHRALLQEVEQADNPTTLVERARAMIDQARRAGSEIGVAQERDYLQSVLNFWGNWVFNHTRVYPDVDLYPASPEAQRTRPPLLPAPFQALTGDQAGAPRAGGQPFILATLVSPVNGTQIVLDTPYPLVGMYANLRPSWRLFVVSQDNTRRAVLLGDAHSPDDQPESGTWQVAQPFVATQPGIYRLGVLIAITTGGVEALQTAFRQAQPLDATPEGVIPLFDLAALVAR